MAHAIAGAVWANNPLFCEEYVKGGVNIPPPTDKAEFITQLAEQVALNVNFSAMAVEDLITVLEETLLVIRARPVGDRRRKGTYPHPVYLQAESLSYPIESPQDRSPK